MEKVIYRKKLRRSFLREQILDKKIQLTHDIQGIAIFELNSGLTCWEKAGTVGRESWDGLQIEQQIELDAHDGNERLQEEDGLEAL